MNRKNDNGTFEKFKFLYSFKFKNSYEKSMLRYLNLHLIKSSLFAHINVIFCVA